MFEAAKASSEAKGSKVWAIGVDSDQYNTSDPAVKDYILTSMIKRVDVAVFEIIKAQMDGNVKGGPTRYDLSVDGVGYATSGGFVDDIRRTSWRPTRPTSSAARSSCRLTRPRSDHRLTTREMQSI